MLPKKYRLANTKQDGILIGIEMNPVRTMRFLTSATFSRVTSYGMHRTQ
jgi:hypothetical protein